MVGLTPWWLICSQTLHVVSGANVVKVLLPHDGNGQSNGSAFVIVQRRFFACGLSLVFLYGTQYERCSWKCEFHPATCSTLACGVAVPAETAAACVCCCETGVPGLCGER